MNPRLEIDLDKIHHNARTLVERLAKRGISVTGVTKATLGSPEIACALLRAGVSSLGDSRIENIEAMRRARVAASTTLIRSPMLGQVDRVVTQRRRELQHRTRRHQQTFVCRAESQTDARDRPHGRAWRPPRRHHARRPRKHRT